jgi:ABC-type phosphate/phosphonate transport system ATPase subunit
MRLHLFSCAGVVCIALLFDPAACDAQVTESDLARIEHVVVIYAENRSFDHLYGFFPGANGIAQATEEQKTQLDHDGTPLPHLWIFNHGKPDERFPTMPNGPFAIGEAPISMSAGKVLPSPIHAFYHNKEQINGGRNNLFAAMSNVGGWVMGYFDGSKLKLWQWAREYTLADNFFMAAYGGSYLNHLWLICACTPKHSDAPDSMRALLDQTGKLKKKPESPSARDGAVQVYSAGGGQVTPDGYSVNTTQPPYQPSGVPPASEANLDFADPQGNDRFKLPLPPQTLTTIGDLREWRAQCAMIFQQFNLVPRLQVMTNVLLGRISYHSTLRTLLMTFPAKDRELTIRVLQRLGMWSHALCRVDELSGDQQQRVAIARALVQEPKILLADEPIASLDLRNATIVMDVLRRINREDGITVISNLHLQTAKDYCDRIIGLRQGVIVFDGLPSELSDSLAREIYSSEENGDEEIELHSTRNRLPSA